MQTTNQRGALGPIAPQLSNPWVIINSSLAQPTWFVNNVTGSDGASGATSATALASLTEYTRRIGTGIATVPQTVTVETNLDSLVDGEVEFRGVYPDTAFLILQGTLSVFGSGSITAATNYDETTVPGTRGTITDSGLPPGSWTAAGFVGKLLVLTAGAQAGATAWIVKDLGADVAGFTPFDNFFSIVDPTLDTYDIVDITSLTGATRYAHKGTILVRYIDHIGQASQPGFIHECGNLTVLQSRIRGNGPNMIAAGDLATWDGTLVNPTGSTAQIQAGVCLVSACGLVGTLRTTSSQGTIEVIGDTMVQGDFQTGATLEATSCGTLLVDSSGWVGFFDNPNANTPAVKVQTDASLELNGKVWGLNWDNASFGIWIDSGGNAVYTDSAPGTLAAVADIDGAGITEVYLAGVPSTYAQVGTVGMTSVQRGTATLAGGGPPSSVTVTANVTANSAITVSHNTPAGTVGSLSVPTAGRTNNSAIGVVGSFQIDSDDALDTSTVDWIVSDPDRGAQIVPYERNP